MRACVRACCRLACSCLNVCNRPGQRYLRLLRFKGFGKVPVPRWWFPSRAHRTTSGGHRWRTFESPDSLRQKTFLELQLSHFVVIVSLRVHGDCCLDSLIKNFWFAVTCVGLALLRHVVVRRVGLLGRLPALVLHCARVSLRRPWLRVIFCTSSPSVVKVVVAVIAVLSCCCVVDAFFCT